MAHVCLGHNLETGQRVTTPGEIQTSPEEFSPVACASQDWSLLGAVCFQAFRKVIVVSSTLVHSGSPKIETTSFRFGSLSKKRAT